MNINWEQVDENTYQRSTHDYFVSLHPNREWWFVVTPNPGMVGQFASAEDAIDHVETVLLEICAK